MKNTNFSKRSLVVSVLALFICFAMLLGTTFAWFTDTATSTNNIIKTGTFELAVSWAEGTEDPDNANWANADTGAIFNHDKWEPGYVDVKHIKIENKGNLALKYMVKIVANGEVTDLSDVIDVYYSDPAVQVTDRASLGTKLGTLTEVLAGMETTAAGKLLEGETDTITLALKMQEDAGNEYINKSIGTDFSVIFLATQVAHEEDGLGTNDYDNDAPYVSVSTEEELRAVLATGGWAKLTADITAANGERFDIPAGKIVSIDLNGYTLTSKDGGSGNWMAIYVNDGANFTLEDSVGTGKVVSSCYGVYVKIGATFVMNGGTLDVHGNGQYDMAVCLYNGNFVMNAGTIDAKFAVWVDNYYKNNGNPDAPVATVTIKDGCSVITTDYAAIDAYDAPDAVIKVPANVTVYR